MWLITCIKGKIMFYCLYCLESVYTFYDDIKKCECCISCGNSMEKTNVGN